MNIQVESAYFALTIALFVLLCDIQVVKIQIFYITWIIMKSYKFNNYKKNKKKRAKEQNDV